MRRLLFVLGLLFLFAPVDVAAAATQHVAIQDYAYGPATLTVQVGDTVEWVNHDQASHDVATTSAPAAFHSPMLATGQTWSFTFTVPGTYSYYCSVHPDMRAQIIVLPAPEPAPAPAQPAQPEETVAAPPPTTTAAPAAPATTPPPPTTTTTVAQAQQTTHTTQAAMPASLDPMLLVAGLVAAVTILCLLLMNAKPE